MSDNHIYIEKRPTMSDNHIYIEKRPTMSDNHHHNLDRIEGSSDTIVPVVHHGGGGGNQEQLQREQLLLPPPPPPPSSSGMVPSHFLQGVPVHTFVNVMEIPDPPTPECSKITVSSPTPTSTDHQRQRQPLQPYVTNTVHHHHPQRRRNSFSTYTTTNDDHHHHLSTIPRKISSMVTQQPPSEHRTFTSCESNTKRRSSMCHVEFPVGGGTSELRRNSHHPSSSSSSSSQSLLHAAPSLDSSSSAEQQVVCLLQPPPLKQRRRSSVPLPLPLPVLPTFATQQVHVASLGSVQEDPARMIITLPPTVDTPIAATVVECSAQLPLPRQVTDTTIAWLRQIRTLVHAYQSVKNTLAATAKTQMEVTDERRTESTVATHRPEYSPNDDHHHDEEEQVVQQIRALTGYVIVPSLSALYTNPSVESPHADDYDDDAAAARQLQQQQERQRRFRRYMGNGPDVRTMERNKQAAVECIRNTMGARYERNKPPTNSSSSSSSSSTGSVFYRYYDIPTGQRITSEEYEQRYLHMLQQTTNVWGTYFTHLHQSQPRHAPLYHCHPETAVVVDPGSSDTSIRGGGGVDVVVEKKMKDVEPPNIPPIPCRTSRVADNDNDDNDDATTIMMTTPQQQQMQQAAEERLWDAIDVALEIYSQEILQIRDHGHKNTK
jgi:hypothetical protein